MPVSPDLRWQPPKDQQISASSFKELLEQIVTWYHGKFPPLSETNKLDMENLADIVPAFVLLTQDIDNMINTKTGEYLPAFDQSQETNGPIWDDIHAAFQSKFPHLHDIFLKYLHWSHASQPVEIDIPIGSRPPVGRYTPNFRRMSSPPSDRKPNRGRPNDKRSTSGNKPHDNKRSHKDSKHDKKPDQKAEQESLKQVLVAVQKLNENSELDEYRLPPANSFYRRLQHQQIKEEGLFSKSAGEGKDRAVVVLKNPT